MQRILLQQFDLLTINLLPKSKWCPYDLRAQNMLMLTTVETQPGGFSADLVFQLLS